jgi:DNA-binding NarL/FixJ family response regulator
MKPLSDCILIVDDESLIALSLRHQISRIGIEVCGTAATATQAIALAQQYRPKIVLMDVRLRGGSDGVDAALEIHDSVGSKVIFLTRSHAPATLARIQQDHPTAVLFKPTSERQLRSAIQAALLDAG